MGRKVNWEKYTPEFHLQEGEKVVRELRVTKLGMLMMIVTIVAVVVFVVVVMLVVVLLTVIIRYQSSLVHHPYCYHTWNIFILLAIFPLCKNS